VNVSRGSPFSTRPGANGVVELTPFEILDRVTDLVPPPRKYRHRSHRVFAPNHRLRKAVTSLAIGNSGKRGRRDQDRRNRALVAHSRHTSANPPSPNPATAAGSGTVNAIAVTSRCGPEETKDVVALAVDTV